MFKGRSDIVSALQQMAMTRDHMASFTRGHPGTKGANLFAGYIKRINWIFNDLYTNPFLDAKVREGIKREVESDVFAVPEITGKIALLSPAQREALEEVIDRVAAGEDLIIDEKQVNI